MLTARPRVLIVEDEPYLRQSLAELFTAEGYQVYEAEDGEHALERLAQLADLPHVILLDLKMPRRGGMETMETLKAHAETRKIPIVIITSFGGSEQTIAAMKAGAYDYITKPFDADEVVRMAARAVQGSRLSHEVERLQGREAGKSPDTELVGCHPLMQEVFKCIGKVATTDSTVLITGESGTGKEGVARAIHRHSARAAHPLVTINCATIPETLLESELFGHERGAFTGAVQAKLGRLEMAEGGTVFLDEIGELSLGLQTKLLRVLQERVFERVGGGRELRVNFRLLAATNRDLDQQIADGRFREDLFYRLNVVRIEMPPLRTRRSDIPMLVEHFLRRSARDHPDAPSALTDEALRVLLLFDFPGNVRELENVIQRACVVARGTLISLDDLPALLTGHSAAHEEPRLRELWTLPFEDAVRTLERMLITRALARAHGNKAEAARLLQIHRSHLYTKLKELGIK